MTKTVPPSQVVVAVMSGLATTAYYASPDFIASRTTRGWVKAGLGAVTATAAVPDLLRSRASERELEQAQEQQTADTPTAEGLADLSTRGKVILGVVGATLLAGATWASVATERWTFRRGEARAAAGVRLPHTRGALLHGALAAGLCLIPVPSESATPVGTGAAR